MLAKLKLYAILGLINLVVIGGMFGFGIYKGYGWGADDVQAKWNKANATAIDGKIDVKAKQDEIQNAPMDTATTTRRLRDATF